MDFFPEMRSQAWWDHNAKSNPRRAVSHRLDLMADKKRKQSAKKYTLEEIAKAARDYRAGMAVDDDNIVQAVASGYLTESEAMNRDY